MLKFAYQLGIKLAMAEEGLLGEEEEGESPADQLAAVLQQIPDPEQEPKPPKKKGIGDPDDTSSYGERSANYAFDDLSHLGLDVQGPDSTAI